MVGSNAARKAADSAGTKKAATNSLMGMSLDVSDLILNGFKECSHFHVMLDHSYDALYVVWGIRQLIILLHRSFYCTDTEDTSF